MTKEESLALAKSLINEEMAKVKSLWSKEKDIHLYSWGWRDEYTISSDHARQFFYIDFIIDLVRALHLDYTVSVGKNLDDEPTVYISLF